MATTSEHGVLPLEPVAQPRRPSVRLLYWMTRRRYGVTPMAFRVMYARRPALALVSTVIVWVLERRLGISKELRFLLQVYVSSQAGCTFCADLTRAEAIRVRMGAGRFDDLLEFRQSDRFTAAERAALGYADAVSNSIRVPDPIFDALLEQFDEAQLVDIVWVCAVERYFNAMALPLRIGSDHLAGGGDKPRGEDAALGVYSATETK